jgi:hypothetical protein
MIIGLDIIEGLEEEKIAFLEVCNMYKRSMDVAPQLTAGEPRFR